MDLPDIVPEIKEFFGKLLGPSAEELGIWGGEKIRFLRFKSTIKTFARAQELLREAGFSEPKPVDIKTLLPLIEYCSLEAEDSDLIEKWAGLLATSSSSGIRTYSFPNLLSQLSPIEAKFLDFVFDTVINVMPEYEWKEKGVNIHVYFINNNISYKDVNIYSENLLRLRLCYQTGTSSITIGSLKISENILFNLTPLGIEFVKACRGPKRL